MSRYAARLVALAALVALSLPAAAACKTGFVPRLAAEGDDVCVLPATRLRTAGENARAPLFWTSGPYGPKTCPAGFVWREAFVGDFACVAPAIRAETRQDNADAPARRG